MLGLALATVGFLGFAGTSLAGGGPLAAAIVPADATVRLVQQRRTTPLRGSKMCSVVLSGEWRDTIPVPQSWTSRDCHNFAQALTAQNYQLACVFDGGPGFSFGPAARIQADPNRSIAGLPSPNCGWTVGPDAQELRRRQLRRQSPFR